MRTSAIIICILTLPLAARGENTAKATLSGTLIDLSGAVIGYVNVELYAPDGSLIGSEKSDAAGHFQFLGLAPGRYRVRVAAQGFVTFERELKVRSTKRLDITLSSISQPDAPLSILTAELRKTAGANAKNCGHVEYRKSPKHASDCAISSFERKRPFYVSYIVPGIDSTAAVAVAYRDEKFRVFQFDSMGWAPSELGANQIAIGHHVIATDCAMPTQLQRNAQGRLSWTPSCNVTLDD